MHDDVHQGGEREGREGVRLDAREGVMPEGALCIATSISKYLRAKSMVSAA